MWWWRWQLIVILRIVMWWVVLIHPFNILGLVSFFRSRWPQSAVTTDAPSTGAATWSMSGAWTVPRPAPRTRPSASSSSGTSWRPPPSGTSRTPPFTLATNSPSSTQNCTTVCPALSTTRSSGTGPERLGRTGWLVFCHCDLFTLPFYFKKSNLKATIFLTFFFSSPFVSRTPPPRYPIRAPMNNQGQNKPPGTRA